jgi:transposase
MIRADVRVWLATAPLDMRRGFDRLAEHVRTILALDPMSGHLFVFRSRSSERVKILWWDAGGKASTGDGYCIYYKRLERGTFVFPDPTDDRQTIAIDSAQLMKLLSGLPVEKVLSSAVDTANTSSRHG